MTIVDLLKDDKMSARVVVGNIQIVMIENHNEWIVYQRKPHARQIKCLYRGNDEDEAVRITMENA